MGRREQKERERKRAAASCHMLDRFMSSKKPKQDETSCSESTSLESDTDKAKDQSPAESTLVASAPSTSGELSVCGDDLVGRTAHCLSAFLPSFCFHCRSSRNDWIQTSP